MTVVTRVGPLEYGVAQVAAPEERHAGDRGAVVATDGGAVVVVADGLGHGPEAESAAAGAVAIVEAHRHEALVPLMRRCHESLRGTRGAVVSIARVENDGRLEWLGVGNVQGAVTATSGTTTRLVTRGGVIGGRLPPLRSTVLRLAPGDVVTLFTDGVDDRAVHDVRPLERPQALAGALLERHTVGRDDALVLVARFLRERP